MTDPQQAAQSHRVVRFPEAAPPPHPCVELDAQWRYTVVNEATLADLSLTRGEMIGRTIWDVFPGLQDSPIGRSMLNVMQTREPYSARQGAFKRPGYDVFTDMTPQPGGGIRVVYRVTMVATAKDAKRRA